MSDQDRTTHPVDQEERERALLAGAPDIAIGQIWEKKSLPVSTFVEVIDYDGESISVKWKGRRQHLSVKAFLEQGFRLVEKESAGEPSLAPRWSEEWPTEPGRYWFYGHRRGSEARLAPRLFAAKVIRSAPLTAIAEGALLVRDAGAQGLWLPLAEPEPPEWSDK